VLYPAERQQAVADRVAERGRVSVAALAEEFGVTTETVRRDLAVLERGGVLRRVHGGAVPAWTTARREPGLEERSAEAVDRKAAIARAALELLPGTGGSVLLDGGSTTAALAGLLPDDRDLHVVTNAVPIAATLVQAAGLRLQVLGGRVRGVTQCAVGEVTVRDLAGLRVDVAFLGTNGAVPGRGFSTPDEAEAAVKRAMVAAGGQVVVLADSSKLGRESLVRFAAPGDVDLLVTDAGADDDVVAGLREAGVEVVLA
jgi:DeoR family fructose operon transcriptional repressor